MISFSSSSLRPFSSFLFPILTFLSASLYSTIFIPHSFICPTICPSLPSCWNNLSLFSMIAICPSLQTTSPESPNIGQKCTWNWLLCLPSFEKSLTNYIFLSVTIHDENNITITHKHFVFKAVNVSVTYSLISLCTF